MEMTYHDFVLYVHKLAQAKLAGHSTVTDLAKFLGLSTSVPRASAE